MNGPLLQELTVDTGVPGTLCRCGHPVSDHVNAGPDEPNEVCVTRLEDESAGWYGVCGCVRKWDDRDED